MTRPLTGVLAALLVVAALAPAAIGPAAAADVTLTVTVENRFGGTVQGAELTATWDGGSTTETTRANGQALIDVPEGADVTISVDHDTYMRNHPVTVDDARTRNVRVSVAQRGEARITIRGGDGPVEDASVRFIADGRTAETVRTDDEGVASSGPLEQGSYDIAVSRPGYYNDRISVGVGEETERTLGIRRGSVQVTFEVQDDHFDDPRPVENATVEIQPIGSTLVTLSDGEASTALPVNRNYQVTVSKPGYRSVTQTLGIVEHDTTMTATISRTPDVSLTAANQQVVVGESTRLTVTDEYGAPVADVPLTVDGEEVARTDADGEATVSVESAGEMTVQANHEGNDASVTVEGVGSGGGDATGESDAETDGGIGPGFGPIVALLAVVIAAGLFVRRR